VKYYTGEVVESTKLLFPIFSHIGISLPMLDDLKLVISKVQNIRNSEILKIVHPCDKDEIEKNLAHPKFPEKIEFRIIDKDNKIKWIEATHINFNNDNMEFIGSFSRDITEIKKSQELNIAF